jgi:dTDP-4-dehydrorhamnose 3,5-epimerase
VGSSPGQFRKTETGIPGCLLLYPRLFDDHRGRFVKTYQRASFRDLGLTDQWSEDVWSSSHRGVLRGLHFQKPPSDRAKLVMCALGTVVDAIVDLRHSSPTFGRHFCTTLDSGTCSALYVPRGIAHGYQVTSPEALMLYKMEAEYDPDLDTGIRWDSCGIEWPLDPILSERDMSFDGLETYMLSPLFS